ncbi:hypothetical protein D3C80_1260920 [compost metagenome]
MIFPVPVASFTISSDCPSVNVTFAFKTMELQEKLPPLYGALIITGSAKPGADGDQLPFQVLVVSDEATSVLHGSTFDPNEK